MSLEDILQFVIDRQYEHEVIYEEPEGKKDAIARIKISMKCPQIINDEDEIFDCDVEVEKVENGFRLTLQSNFSIAAQQFQNVSLEKAKNQIEEYDNMMKGNGGDYSALIEMIHEMQEIEAQYNAKQADESNDDQNDESNDEQAEECDD